MNTNADTSQRIAIVLSTYNGAQYIGQQLDAILKQSYKNWRCYIRDDGSKDNTISILKKYSAIDNRIVFLDDQKGNMGLNPSHYYLLSIPEENYITTCDQDDVWHANKLEVSINKLKEIETQEKLPALVHTDSVFVDSHLNVMRDQFIGKRGQRSGLNGIIFANSVQGGSIMINKSLNDIAIKIPPKLPYDYHLGIIAELVGIRAFIPQTLLLYRQHSKSSIATSDAGRGEINEHPDMSSTLRLSLGGYHHIKYDFVEIMPQVKAKQALREYYYLFEGNSRLKKLMIALKNHYPFYRKKDYLQFLLLILKNKNLINLDKQL
jgi:glycosyltransferase involved in cell wall biosynthesis